MRLFSRVDLGVLQLGLTVSLSHSGPQTSTDGPEQALLTATDGTCGYWQFRAPSASPKLVRQIIRAEGLAASPPRPFRVTTEADAGWPSLLRIEAIRRHPAVPRWGKSRGVVGFWGRDSG